MDITTEKEFMSDMGVAWNDEIGEWSFERNSANRSINKQFNRETRSSDRQVSEVLMLYEQL